MLGLGLAGQGRRDEAQPLIEQTIKWNKEHHRSPLYASALKSFQQ